MSTHGQMINARESRTEAVAVGAVLMCTALALLAAWASALSYVPTLDDAHLSVVYREAGDPASGLARSVRTFAASGALAGVMFLLGYLFFKRGYRRGGKMNRRWFIALALLPLLAAWSSVGQLLVMDQDAWHGTLTRRGIVESMPGGGPRLANALFGGSEISSETISRFFLLHTTFMPLGLLALLWLLWRARPRGRALALAAGALLAAVVANLLLALWPDAAAVDIAARPGESFDSRPEWFFLPLSVLLSLLPGKAWSGVMTLLPALLLIIGAAWPWIWERREGIADRILLFVGLALYLGLMGWGFAGDAFRDEGYFKPPRDLESAMTEAGKLNERLGDGAGPLPADAAHIAADLLVLARRMEGQEPQQGKHTRRKDAPPDRTWAALTDDYRAAVRGLWRIPPGEGAARRKALRVACLNCHEAYGVEDDLFLEDHEPAGAAPRRSAITVHTRFAREAFEGLKPTSDVPLTMGKLMVRMRRAYNTLNEYDPEQSAQALLDMKAFSAALPLIYEEYRADLEDAVKDASAKWTRSTFDTVDALDALVRTRDEVSYRDALDELRKQCIACHDDFESYVEDHDDLHIAPVLRAAGR